VCLQQAKQREAEEREAARIDWLAVEAVIQGHTANLNSAERRLVVRRLADRLTVDGDLQNLPPGRLTATMLAARMGVGSSAVQAIVKRLPPATRRRCPECRGPMWVLEDGTVEEHGDGFLARCAMSGVRERVAS